jgi:hypothetical protein
LPTGKPVTEADLLGEAVAFGPQAELCRRTRCVACFAVAEWRRAGGRRIAIDWLRLPTYDAGHLLTPSHPHHEPPRSTRADSHDEDTIPLCATHHFEGVGACVRHRIGFADEENAARFYGLLPFDWQAARDEMRRRTAARKSLAPVVGAEGAGSRNDLPCAVAPTEPGPGGDMGDDPGDDPGRASMEDER